MYAFRSEIGIYFSEMGCLKYSSECGVYLVGVSWSCSYDEKCDIKMKNYTQIVGQE